MAFTTRLTVLEPQLIADCTESVLNEEVLAEQKLQEKALEVCLRKLNGVSAQILNYFYQKKLRTDEIARRLNLKGNTIRTRLSRLRGKLRQCVEQQMKEQR